MNNVLLAACLAVTLSGCAGSINLQESTRGTALTPQILKSEQFNLQALVPPPAAYKHLRVYIEGDGHAWATSSQPSTDPTPHTSMMVTFAAHDRLPAAYLARPCQFVTSEQCGTAVWTSDRFGSTAIAAMSAGLDALKQQFGVNDFELVGHSGGGAVALVLAGQRSDVSQVQTIAGNVDPIYWAWQKNLTPLTNPETPLKYMARLQTIPQRHYLGLNDAVVPSTVTYKYASQLKGKCIDLVETAATHNSGFAESWLRLSNQAIPCDAQ